MFLSEFDSDATFYARLLLVFILLFSCLFAELVFVCLFALIGTLGK